MKKLNLRLGSILLLVLAGILFSIPGAGVSMAKSGDESVKMNLKKGELFVKGRVKTILYEENVLVVKPKKGKKVHIHVVKQTSLMGFVFLKELADRQTVKVWYVVDEGKNKALKVELIPKLGC